MGFRVLLLAGLVLLAGCSGAYQEAPSPTATPTPETSTTPAPETTATPTTSAAPTPTATTTATATTQTTTTASTQTPTTHTETTPCDAEQAGDTTANPWRAETVTVAVSNEANQSRDVAPLVNETLAYWNACAGEYGDYEVRFVSRPNAADPDVVVAFVDRIQSCGAGADNHTAVGCAAVLGPDSVPDDPERVEVVAGYTDESTVRIMKHEFGHLLGLEHGEEPMPLMAAFSEHRYLSRPDATDRPVPWENATLSVHVDAANVTSGDEAAVREQVGNALTYYAEGADGRVPANVSFVRTANRSATDVRISFPDEPFDCGGELLSEGSCGWLWGYNTDADDAYEYYSGFDVRVRNVDTEAVGWHVGYWLASAFGLSGEEIPDPFVDADHDDRRGEWWE